MKIKLVRTGGFIPVTKVAETEVDITDMELYSLIEAIQTDPSRPKIKDGHSYELAFGDTSSPVDLEKVPPEFKDLFDRLKNNLKILNKT